MMDRQWTGVVLAGGRSSRMGRDKALLPWDGGTLLEFAVERLRPHVREVLVIGDPERYSVTHAITVPDELAGLGPLGGLVTALRRARYDRALITACDLPGLNDRLLMALKRTLGPSGADAVVPTHKDHWEPLAAAYHRRCLEPFERQLRLQQLRLTTALGEVDVRTLPVEPGAHGWPQDLFRNLNRPEDL